MTGHTRGQTTLDFAIAMGVFLLAVAFVFTFIPTMTGPFVDGTQDHTAAADRTASHLAEGGLGDPAEPYVIQEQCASAFFEEAAGEDVPEGCGFDGNSTKEHVGVADRLGVYVEVVRRNDTDEFDVGRGPDGLVTHTGLDSIDAADLDPVYRVGEEPHEGASTTVARRVVTVEDCDFGDAGACDVTLRVVVH